MGRRKIEIQPITHERNRSVTFLKRKNGLFKKAYELGVLCSVDVAVIIFEERTGHHLKLYQYCSGDIHDIVQRHIRYDGEKDTRTPHDFANNTNTKVDDNADGDDDDGDDDDPDAVPTRGAGAKKRTEPKLKQDHGNSNGKLVISPPTGNDIGVNAEMNGYHLHRPMTIPPPPMPLHHSSAGGGGGSSLPVSTERHTSSAAPNLSASKLPSDDPMYNSYLPSPTSAASSAYRHNSQPSHHQLPYNSYLGVSSPPPPPFASSPFDFPASSGSRNAPAIPPRSTGYSSARTSTYPQDQTSFHQGIYHPLMRSHHPHAQPSSTPPGLLSSFLEHDDHHSHPHPHSQRQGSGQFAPIDWPTHAQHPQQGPASASSSVAAAAQESGPPSGDTSWLDFLSHNAPHPHMALAPPSSSNVASLPPSAGAGAGPGSAGGANGRDTMSTWDRERDVEHFGTGSSSSGGAASQTSAERGSGGDKAAAANGSGPGGGAGVVSPRASRKRPRTSSGVDEGGSGRRHGTPPGVAARGGGGGGEKTESKDE